MTSLFDRLADRLEAVDPRTEYTTAGQLARALDPAMIQTPALDVIDAALADVDAGLSDRLIVSMPPQEGKSERVTHYGVLWFLMRHPERRIGVVSFGEGPAARMSYAVRNDIATHASGGESAVDLGLRLRPDSKAAGRWNLAGQRGGVYAVGIGGALTSRPLEMLVIDDPIKDYRAADSDQQSETVWEWWQSVARPRLAPGAAVILVMTRWHENDLAGRLLAKQSEDQRAGLVNYDRWRVVNIPAQANHRAGCGESDPLGRAPGEYMTSARGRTVAQWEATKAATSSRIWNALYQGAPSPDEGTLFKRADWQRYDAPKAALADDGSWHCPGADRLIQSWDMAFKDRNSSDYVVGQVWAQFGLDVYLLDQVHERLSFTATCDAVQRLSAKWPQASAKLVEDKANGTAVIDQLRTVVSGLIPINPGSDSKYVRALAVSPFVEARQVWLPSDRLASWSAGFVEEHAKFPNSAHDDQVDAMSQALNRLLVGNRGPLSAASPVGRYSNARRMPAVPLRLPR